MKEFWSWWGNFSGFQLGEKMGFDILIKFDADK